MDIHSWWYPLNVILLNMADQLKFRLKNEALFREQHDTIESIGRCLLLVGQVRVVRERGAVREQSAVWKGSECFVRGCSGKWRRLSRMDAAGSGIFDSDRPVISGVLHGVIRLFLCSRFVRAIRVRSFLLVSFRFVRAIIKICWFVC